MSCINRSVIGHGPQDYALRVEMSALEDQADNGKARELRWKPMSWLGTLRPTTVDDAWAPAIWQTFFTSTLGLEVPVLSSLARQRRRRPPQIPAARGSPSRWRGRPRVGSGSGPPVRRRNAETRVRPHLNAARRQNSCSSATRETTPQFLAARGSPSRWRGRWRVGSIIPCRAFVQQTPNGAELRPVRPASQAGASRRKYDAREDGGGGWCM